jgi:hypothetical protein
MIQINGLGVVVGNQVERRQGIIDRYPATAREIVGCSERQHADGGARTAASIHHPGDHLINGTVATARHDGFDPGRGLPGHTDRIAAFPGHPHLNSVPCSRIRSTASRTSGRAAALP